MKRIVLLGVLIAATLQAQEGAPIPFAEDRIMAAILASDPVAASHFLMPGFYVLLEQYEEYRHWAEKITNENTYPKIKEYGLSDVRYFLSGVAKVALGACVLWWAASGLDYAKAFEINLDNAKKLCVALSGLYAAFRGLKDFDKIRTRSELLLNHHNALAVEALIKRLPVCRKGEAPEIIKS